MKKITVDEWNLISQLTHVTRIDQSFDIIHDEELDKDMFFDFEEGKNMSIEDGISQLYEAMAYPLTHVGYNFSEDEIRVLIGVFKKFGFKDADWLKNADII